MVAPWAEQHFPQGQIQRAAFVAAGRNAPPRFRPGHCLPVHNNRRHSLWVPAQSQRRFGRRHGARECLLGSAYGEGVGAGVSVGVGEGSGVSRRRGGGIGGPIIRPAHLCRCHKAQTGYSGPRYRPPSGRGCIESVPLPAGSAGRNGRPDHPHNSRTRPAPAAGAAPRRPYRPSGWCGNPG